MTTELMMPSTTAPNAGVSTVNPNHGDTRECLITVCLTPFRPNLFKPFALDYVGRPAWAGLLLDSASLDNGQPFIPVGQVFSHDDTLVGRDSVVGSLKDIAFLDGYSQCEVRNYFYGHEDRYETIFSGPLHEDNAGVV